MLHDIVMTVRENRKVIKNDNSETLTMSGTKKQNEDKQSKKREHRKLKL
jgi:hypothetical protein